MNEEAFDPGKGARTASGIPVVPAFDGYRAWAIFLVVLYHVSLFSGLLTGASDSWRVAIFGWLAEVPLTMLFIISGFVLFLPTVARDGEFGSVGNFWLRRAARIFPAFWLVLVISLILLATLPKLGPFPGVDSIAEHFTMLHTPATLFDDNAVLGFGVVAAVWTLPVEIVYYLVLPVFAKAYFRRPLVGLAIAAVVYVAWRLFALHIGDVFDTFGLHLSDAAQARWSIFYSRQFPAWGLAIAAGMTGAWALVRLQRSVEPELLAKRARTVAVIAAAGTVVVSAFAGQDAVDNPDVLNGIFAYGSMGVGLALPLVTATLMIALALSPRRVQSPFASEPVRYMGDISYGVYLIHLAIIVILAKVTGMPATGSIGNYIAWCAIVILGSLVFAYLSATLLEHPVRRWARGVTARRRERALGQPQPAVGKR